ncbi:hypothetical protein RBB50_004933 [Rhinocladiella similis]
MPVVSPEKRRRKWARKVRSGCKTCKMRRKKCDEARPCCLRCITDHYLCDGYDTPKAWIFLPCSGDNVTSHSSQRQSPKRPSFLKGDVLNDYNSQEDCSGAPTKNAELHDVSIIGPKPSDLWVSGPDALYTDYFLHQVVPLLATTQEWRLFWSNLVPRVSWSNQVIHHAVIALAAAYESKVSAKDHKELILRRSNQAIRNFRTQHNSVDVALVLCRIFASIARCNRDPCSAMMHMRNGGQIIREAHREISFDIVRITAPAFLGATAYDATHNANHIVCPRLLKLDSIRLQYQQLLGSLHRRHRWSILHPASRSFILISCAIMTQAVCAAMYPDILNYKLNDTILPVDDVRAALIAKQDLLSADTLETLFIQATEQIYTCLEQASSITALPDSLQHLVKICVDNFVVYIATIEPRITAGTFWQDHYEVPCAIDSYFGHAPSHPTPVVTRDHNCEGRQFFLEFVCPYRSGFLLPFCD